MVNGEKKVLVIDPDPKARRDITAELKNENYSIETGKCLTEAIKKIPQGDFACLIMDVNLPEMKGYEAVSIIKNIDPKIKIIITTEKNTKRLEAKVREQDIFFYFIKSFGVEELRLAINNVFNLKGGAKMEKANPKILVVDDDPDFIEAVTPILKSALYEVVTAADPKEAKEKIFSAKPDLILLDIMMDSLFDGFSLCHAVKTSKEYRDFRNTPIIFVSAVKEKTGSRFQFKGEEEGMAGPDDYIDKPVKPNDLLARIESLLKK